MTRFNFKTFFFDFTKKKFLVTEVRNSLETYEFMIYIGRLHLKVTN